MIGLSLPLDYLAGDAPATPAAAAWQTALGSADASLAALKEAGVTSIELRFIPRDAPGARVLAAAQRVWDAGLATTLHGHLPAPPLAATFAGLYPSLAPLAEALARRGAQSVVTLHCYATPGAPAEDLAARTASALATITAVLERESIPLRIALENDGARTQAGPSVTYRGILQIIRQVGSGRLGACWDFGHAQANVLAGRLEAAPDAAYLASVIHTHVHDLGPRTHFPLSCGAVPVERFLDVLLAEGYSGVLNLELSPDRFPEQPLAESVYASIERLAAHLRRRAGP